MTGLTVVSTGEARSADLAGCSRNGPSFYADPVAWLVTAAITGAIERGPLDVTAAADEVAVIVLSRGCTTPTMRTIAGTAGRGLVSPLRFAGANPGVLAGLPCITHALRGPSLVLATPVADGLAVAAVVAGSWLVTGQARYVLVAAHERDAGGHAVRCVLLRAARGAEPGDRLDALAPIPATAAGATR